MENYYSDERVILALSKSDKLMDILTFVKEVNFEIKDNLGFDVLWDSITDHILPAKRWAHMGPSLLKWLGYTRTDVDNKKNFIKLLESNDIEYQEI
jgi:hypothetical protein